MTIDELEYEINKSEREEFINLISGEIDPSPMRRQCWLYEVVKRNDLKILRWPKVILAPSESFDKDSGALEDPERIYKSGVVERPTSILPCHAKVDDEFICKRDLNNLITDVVVDLKPDVNANSLNKEYIDHKGSALNRLVNEIIQLFEKTSEGDS